jgi:hypothetical protein
VLAGDVIRSSSRTVVAETTARSVAGRLRRVGDGVVVVAVDRSLGLPPPLIHASSVVEAK